jgi:hypothetical protein
MDSVLGIILFVVYIGCIVAVAAGVTWLVVRLTPKRADKKPEPTG